MSTFIDLQPSPREKLAEDYVMRRAAAQIAREYDPDRVHVLLDRAIRLRSRAVQTARAIDLKLSFAQGDADDPFDAEGCARVRAFREELRRKRIDWRTGERLERGA